MNLGDWKKPNTQPGRLFAMLITGRRVSPLDIIEEIGTDAPTTVVSALRKGLERDGAAYVLPKAEKIEMADGRVRHFYRLELRQPAEPELFAR